MTPEQLPALKEVAEKAHRHTPGPYFAAPDSAHDSPDHKDSGLALVETGRCNDWWVARLCEWPTAEFIAAFDPTTCLELLEEVDRLRNQWNTRFNTLCGNCGKRYLGPRDEEQHGIGICGGTK